METFHGYIIEHSKDLFSQEKKFKWIKVHGVRTLENQWQSKLQPYFQRELGDFWHIKIPIKGPGQRKIDFYVTNYTPKLLLFYSASTYWEYEKTLRQFITNTAGQGMMWIGPKKYDDLILHVMDSFRPTLQKFRGIRTEGDTTPSEVRPDVRRVVYYSARDSFQTLNELKARYGIRPTSVTFRVKGGEIQITNEGLFSLTRQSKELFRVLEDSLDFIKISESKLTATAQDVKRDFELIEMSGGTLKFPLLTSASITLKTKNLDNDAIDKFMTNSKRFEFLGSYRKEGSFSWVATSLDKDKKTIFGIDSDENTIDLIPRSDTTFESFLDFYRLILEEVDDGATMSVFGG
jgi:hypothetical protein